MKNLKFLVSLAAAFVLVLVLVQNASALVNIESVEVNGVETLYTNGDVSGINIGAFAGDSLPVRVTFTAHDIALTDARIKIWLTGEKDNSVSSDRFEVLNGSTYSRLVSVPLPANIDPSENFNLRVEIESGDGVADWKEISIVAQRESYQVEVLDANIATKAKAGEAMPVDIVLKNTGSQLAEDTFVKVTIPALGVEQRAYFGDLSAVDQGDDGNHPERSDAVERRMLVNVPKSAPAGVYTVNVEAYNADSDATISKKVAIVGASEDTVVISNAKDKTFAVGDKAQYSITLVNSGNGVEVYELVPEVSDNLNVELSDPVVAISAGTSKTVQMTVGAEKAGEYAFAVNVYSNGELVSKQAFSATVEGNKSIGGNSTTLVLTVVLAIVFVVLLVVLIVLLTRKPEKNDELGENYY